MNNLHISVDSAADLSSEMQLALNISVLPLLVNIDGVALYDKILSGPELNAVADKTLGKKLNITAQSKTFYEDYFDELAENNKNILHICQGSAFSNSYKNAVAAAKNTMVKFHGRTVYVVDGHSSSAGLGLLTDSVAVMHGNGQSPENCFVEICGQAEKLEQYVILGNVDEFNKLFPAKSGLTAEKSGAIALLSVDASGKPHFMRRFTGIGTACAFIAKRYLACHSLSPIYVYGSRNVTALLKAVSSLRKRGLTDIRMSSMGLLNSLMFGEKAIYCAFFGVPEQPRLKKIYSPGKPGDFFDPALF